MASALDTQALGHQIEDLLKTPASDAFFLNEQERRILDLWDKDEELKLELNLLKGQRDIQYHLDVEMANLSDEQVAAEIAKAEKELLTARSKYTIRQNIINQVLIADPILKSLHAGIENTTRLEQRLPPVIKERDTLAMTQNLLASKLQQTQFKIAKLEQQNIDMLAANKAGRKRMLELAHDVKAEKVDEVRDARVRSQLEKLEEEVGRARREWRVWKSVVVGIVVGSGVDWAGDAKLLEVVMDEEDE